MKLREDVVWLPQHSMWQSLWVIFRSYCVQALEHLGFFLDTKSLHRFCCDCQILELSVDQLSDRYSEYTGESAGRIYFYGVRMVIPPYSCVTYYSFAFSWTPQPKRLYRQSLRRCHLNDCFVSACCLTHRDGKQNRERMSGWFNFVVDTLLRRNWKFGTVRNS